MSKYFLFLQTVYDTVHVLALNSLKKKVMQEKFSTPKIFTGGILKTHCNNMKLFENILFIY
jgi:hypothetical protein